MPQVSTTLRITKAKVKIADYDPETGYTSAIAGAVEIGLLKEGVDFNAELVTKDVSLYAFNAKKFITSYFETAKVSGMISDVKRANIDRLLTMFTTTTATGTHTMVLDSSGANTYKEKIVIIEEVDFSANNEKFQYIFFPCHFTGKLDLSYKKDEAVSMSFEFTVYADEGSENGDLGMVIKVIDKV